MTEKQGIIELEHVYRFSKTRALLKVIKWSLVGAIFCLICVATTEGLYKVRDYATFKWIETKYALADALNLVRIETKLVTVEQADLQQLVKMFSNKYGLNPIVGLSLIDRESTNKAYRFRFEQSWKDQYKDKYPKGAMNEEEYNLIFSSIGLMQVSFAIWKQQCNLSSPVDLFSLERNIDCGLKIMATCLYENKQIRDNGQRLRVCFRRYNGNGPKAEQYASEMMSNLANYTINDRELLAAHHNGDLKADVATKQKEQGQLTPITYQEEVREEITNDDRAALDKLIETATKKKKS